MNHSRPREIILYKNCLAGNSETPQKPIHSGSARPQMNLNLRLPEAGAINTFSEMNQAPHQIGLHNRPARRLAALACLVLFLSLQFFASSGALHQSLHADAGSPHHHCAITLLKGGQVAAPVLPSLWMVFTATLLFSVPLIQSAVSSACDLRLAPGRAPPRF